MSQEIFNGYRFSVNDKVRIICEHPHHIDGIFVINNVEPDYYWPDDDECFVNGSECTHGEEWQKIRLAEISEPVGSSFINTCLLLI